MLSRLGIFCLYLFAIACNTASEPVVRPLSQLPLIPLPAAINDQAGAALELSTLTAMVLEDPELMAAAVEAVEESRKSSYPALPALPAVQSGEESPAGPVVRLRTLSSLGAEAYRLEVLPEGLILEASGEAGFFYGLQTLQQMLVAAREDSGFLAAGVIEDSPRFAYRGTMLDIARHFHGEDEIKRLIDLASYYKMNRLHLHLSDDQGWRIEIKSWPRLTEIGAATEVGGTEGGFLTQEAYQRIVAYAAARQLMVIPEIDMPGHTHAALVSYPELDCSGKTLEPYSGIEVGFSTFCIGQPVVRRFIRDVLSELAAITPGPYLHLGGDESHATDSNDYRAFFKEMKPIVDSLGKQMIAWDEIATVDLDTTVVVQIWRGDENLSKALANGQQLIMSPAAYAYLDMQYDSTSRIGLHWASYIEVDRAYQWDPLTVFEGISASDVLGIEAPLWTETVDTRADIDYLVFPRLPGYAEMGWSPQARREWESYRERLKIHLSTLKEMGIGYYASPLLAQ